MEKFYKTKHFAVTVLIVILFFVFGVYIGDIGRPEIDKVTGVANKQTEVATDADFSEFWKVWNAINDKSLAGNTVSDQNKVYGAISGLVGSLNDPYSVFFNPDQAKSFNDEISGSFSGVGMEVGIKDNVLTVIAPLKDTPADKAGMKPGDKILKIDSAVTTNMTIDDAVNLMHGPKGTTVTLTILRVGETVPRVIPIVRDIINTPTLDTTARPDGIFVVTLYSFDADAATLFQAAMQKFQASGDTKLILDLRGNPGGYLDAAVDISSWFLPEGQTVVTEDYGAKQPPDVFRSKGYTLLPNNEKLKFIILIDGGSASAAEFVSGAMQDHGVAKLVGAQSFGKGSVQQVIDMDNGTLLKITVAKWLTPNGTSISEKGLTPDYPVPFTQADANAKKDPQMDKAVELLNQ